MKKTAKNMAYIYFFLALQPVFGILSLEVKSEQCQSGVDKLQELVDLRSVWKIYLFQFGAENVQGV